MHPSSHAEAARPRKLAEMLFFAGQFFRHGKKVASLVPSSKPMARRLAKDVDPARPQVILELGTGTGVVTEAVVERMNRGSRLIAVENNARFARMTARRCPRATMVCRDAVHVGETLDELGVERVDVMINCLPTPSLPASVNGAIYRLADRLMGEVRITQLTELPMLYYRMYKRLFKHVRFAPIVRNIPPAGVYVLCGLRADYEHRLPNRA